MGSIIDSLDLFDMKTNKFNSKQYFADLANILVRMKRFQEEVIKFRQKIGIPIKGLPRVFPPSRR